MTELAFLPATELARSIRSREIGCVELLDYFLARVERFNPAINAVIVRDFDKARARAAAADRMVASGDQLPPLHGVPMTVKESFQLAGTPTTFGFPAFRDNVAAGNALAVDRLLGAGANIFGKTNVPLGLMDGQSVNDIYGRTVNPWDPARTPGGSSGGSAASVAAGLAGAEMGSDIASSIRNPAHFCGVFGHKPTFGLCATRGHSLRGDEAPVDISVIGPLARSADDLELLLSLIAGPTGEAEDAYKVALPPARKNSLREFKVGLVLDDSVAEVDQAVQQQLADLGRFLAAEGVELRTGSHPFADDSAGYNRLYMTLLRAATANRIDEAAYARYVATQNDPAADEIARIDAYGFTMSHRDWLQLDGERQAARAKWREFFAECDLLLCPVLATPAFPHMDGHPAGRMLMVNGRPQPFEAQLFWAGLGGLCYLPASVAPIGLAPGNLPVGVQIIGPEYGDLTCIQFARLLERHYRAFVPPPGFGD